MAKKATGAVTKPATAGPDTLTTTLPDPNFAGETWTITTVRLPGETWMDFMWRHRTQVNATRKFLKGV